MFNIVCVCNNIYQGGTFDEKGYVVECIKYVFTFLGKEEYHGGGENNYKKKIFCERQEIICGGNIDCPVYSTLRTGYFNQLSETDEHYSMSDIKYLGIFDNDNCLNKNDLWYPLPSIEHSDGWMEIPFQGCVYSSSSWNCNSCRILKKDYDNNLFVYTIVREISSTTLYNPICKDGKTTDCRCENTIDWEYDSKNLKCIPKCHGCKKHEICRIPPNFCICEDGYGRKTSSSSCQEIIYHVEITEQDWSGGIIHLKEEKIDVKSHSRKQLNGFDYSGITLKFLTVNSVGLIVDNYIGSITLTESYLPSIYTVLTRSPTSDSFKFTAEYTTSEDTFSVSIKQSFGDDKDDDEKTKNLILGLSLVFLYVVCGFGVFSGIVGVHNKVIGIKFIDDLKLTNRKEEYVELKQQQKEEEEEE